MNRADTRAPPTELFYVPIFQMKRLCGALVDDSEYLRVHRTMARTEAPAAARGNGVAFGFGKPTQGGRDDRARAGAR